MLDYYLINLSVFVFVFVFGHDKKSLFVFVFVFGCFFSIGATLIQTCMDKEKYLDTLILEPGTTYSKAFKICIALGVLKPHILYR